MVSCSGWQRGTSGFEGPRTHPLFDVGRAAPDAPFAAETARRPVILLSHGFGGTARMMSWLGIPLARSG